MNERPILFSAPMVRALLDGSKTQTRRVVKPMPQMVADHMTAPWQGDPAALLSLLTTSGRRCPYGQPSDQLWVRETWAPHPDFPFSTRRAIYRAGVGVEHDVPRWTPAIHMFRWASRIDLQVTDVRVERLQDISEADAIAEGRIDAASAATVRARRNPMAAPDVIGTDSKVHESAIAAYRALWEQINGAGSWAANPWVWVVEFKRIKP